MTSILYCDEDFDFLNFKIPSMTDTQSLIESDEKIAFYDKDKRILINNGVLNIGHEYIVFIKTPRNMRDVIMVASGHTVDVKDNVEFSYECVGVVRTYVDEIVSKCKFIFTPKHESHEVLLFSCFRCTIQLWEHMSNGDMALWAESPTIGLYLSNTK